MKTLTPTTAPAALQEGIIKILLNRMKGNELSILVISIQMMMMMMIAMIAETMKGHEQAAGYR